MPGWATLTLSSRSSGTAMQVNIDNKKQKMNKKYQYFQNNAKCSSKAKK